MVGSLSAWPLSASLLCPRLQREGDDADCASQQPTSLTTMSFRLSAARRLATRRGLLIPSVPPSRSFAVASRLRLKEDKERSPEEADRVKEEQRQKAEAGKGEWHESLASQSESHVAADRQGVKDHDKHMEELQQQTAQDAQKKHPNAK